MRSEDVLQWMIDIAEGEDASEYSLTMKMLFVGIVTHKANAAALEQALLDFVAADHSLKQKLVEEAKHELDAAGGKWTLAALNKMNIMDFLLKESQRLNGASLRESSSSIMPCAVPTTIQLTPSYSRFQSQNLARRDFTGRHCHTIRCDHLPSHLQHYSRCRILG